MKRTYTVQDLNRMRHAILDELSLAEINDEAQIGLLVESRLQTYMMAEVDPDDFCRKSERGVVLTTDADYGTG